MKCWMTMPTDPYFVPRELATDCRLSAYDFRVMLGLLSFFDDEGGRREPGIVELCDHVCMPQNVCRLSLDRLIEFGWIHPEPWKITIPSIPNRGGS